MTAREAAKTLLEEYARRGIRKGEGVEYIVNDVVRAQRGHCWTDYWAQVGVSGGHGVKNGKRIKMQPWHIKIIDINRVPCNEVFDIMDIVEELYRELTQGKQLALWGA